MIYSNLIKYGFTETFIKEAAAYENLFPARIIEQHRTLYKVISETGEIMASVSGKLRLNTNGQIDFPAVGDFVMIDRQDANSGNAVIHHILCRQNIFARKVAGKTSDIQIVAANIDTVFICMSLNSDFNLRRLERYLAIVWDSKANPIIVLTKSDLCNDIENNLKEVCSIAKGAEIIVCSSENGYGLKKVKSFIEIGKTVLFVGSSGVGKSTLINKFLGKDILPTKEIRSYDEKGRHTTTYRQLIMLPDGGLVIDTPGMRELSVSSGNLDKTFEDIEELALNCKYSNCTHINEPKCAVREAIEGGTLSEKRFNNYQKLQREAAYRDLNSRQIENEKINRMFGSKSRMKHFFKGLK